MLNNFTNFNTAHSFTVCKIMHTLLLIFVPSFCQPLSTVDRGRNLLQQACAVHCGASLLS